jgi:Asp-tRNA(Asn)/Glu-tRNA(Gln) amidotransferase A subunit family amidase
MFTKQFPALFPVDAQGKPVGDHVKTLVDLAVRPSLVPNGISLRGFGAAPALGEEYFNTERYLRERGDAAIKTSSELTTKANALRDEATPGGNNRLPPTMNMTNRMLMRFAVQQVVLQCMAELRLDAVTYATSNIPPSKIGAPEPSPVKNNDNWELNTGIWTFFGHYGFPVISVPAGFTTQVYDLEETPGQPNKLREVGPTPAHLPIGIDIAGRPFDEPTLLRIASAYARATKHREPPPDFGPLQ